MGIINIKAKISPSNVCLLSTMVDKYYGGQDRLTIKKNEAVVFYQTEEVFFVVKETKDVINIKEIPNPCGEYESNQLISF